MDDTVIKAIIQNLNIETAPNDIERSHIFCQLRQPGEKPRPIIVNLV